MTAKAPKRVRTDAHRPSAIKPEDYEYVGSFDGELPTPDLVALLRESRVRAHEGPGRCDHCGAHIRYVEVWRHKPSGGHIATGEICAQETMMVPDRATLDVKRLREAAAARSKAARETERRRKEREEVEEKHPDVVPILRSMEAGELRAHGQDWLAEAGDAFHFLEDVARGYLSDGKLTHGQAEAVLRVRDATLRRQRQREESRERAERATGAVPGGKGVEVEGVVERAYYKQSEWGARHVMIVEADAGWRVWGSIPRGLYPDPGDRVRFTADLSRSGEDDLFGFFKRPRDARVVERVANDEGEE